MRSSEDIEYVVATRSDREAVRNALVTFFYPEEPLTMAHRDGPDVTEDDMENSLSFLDLGTVIVARLKTNHDQLVGVSIGGPSDRAVNVSIRTRKFADIVAFLELLYERASLGAIGSRPSYNVHAIAVHPTHRGLRIGRRLVEEQITLAKHRWPTIDSVTVDATGPFSARLMHQLGLKEISRTRFDEYRDVQGDPVFRTVNRSGAEVRYEAVVLGDVTLEDVRAQAKHPLEPGPIELDTFERSAGDNGGGAGSIEQQSNLAEVVGRSETTHFRSFFALKNKKPLLLALYPFKRVGFLPHLSSLLHDGGTSFDDDVEIVTGFTLLDDRFAVLEADRFQRVGHSEPFPFVEALCKKSAEGGQPLIAVEKIVSAVPHLNLADIDDVEVVALVALLDDRLSRQKVAWEHRVEDVRPLVLVQLVASSSVTGSAEMPPRRRTGGAVVCGMGLRSSRSSGVAACLLASSFACSCLGKETCENDLMR
uniref:Uncharacterized protein n=1 Tax=Anopheles atroparvus TaxID=41427 RepID=A0A182J449_ANOAO